MDKSDKVNHKTLFLLDISTGFANKSSEQPIEFDVFTKSRAGIVPLPAICKSLWTCTVESVLEYSRIVWDLFPEGDKLLSFLAFNENGCSRLNSWSDQSLHFLNNNFAQVALTINKNNKSASNSNKDLMLLSVIQECLDQLATFSPLQWESYRRNTDAPIHNRGRLIVVTSFQNNSQVNNFIKSLNAAIVAFNKSISSNEELSETSRLPINELHLVMINTYPTNQNGSKISEMEPTSVSGLLNCELVNSKSGTTIASKMITLLLGHYDLASTTVTNIPMKEEQNASSSANYDVEIVHSNQAHLDLLKNYLTAGEQMNLKSTKEDVSYDTVSLKWCTPKGSSVELHQCTGAYRITAVEINSRPSSCLINFLLGGRTVMLMLDMPRLKGKCMSHVLSSHSGELYIHTLGYNKSIIDDPPAISEGTGGRVTDYRINDFGELMRSMKLDKCKPSGGDLPLERAMQNLGKQTVYWPMTIGHSIIFNLSNQIQPLLSYIPKETLSPEEVNDCQTSLYHLVAMENKNAPLPVPSALPKNKGMKKEELYKLMWKELEYFIERHAITPEHNKVLNCLKELNSKFDTSKENLTGGQNASTKKFSLVDEFDRFNGGAQTSEKPIADLDMPDIKRAKLASDNPAMNKLIRKTMISGSLSLYSLNTQRLELENTRKLKEFKGRQSGSNVAQLYPNLNEPKPENPL